MTSDHYPFWEAIRRDWPNQHAGQVYADWLDEHNDPRAEWMRVQLRLEGIDRADPDALELKARERLLEQELRPTILGSLRSLTKQVEFRGGLLIPHINGRNFVRNWKDVFDETPVVGVRFNNLDSLNFGQLDEFESLKYLSLQGGTTRQRDRVDLLQTANLHNVVELVAGEAAERPEFARSYLDGRFPSLKKIGLRTSRSFDVKDLLRSEQTANLVELSLLANPDEVADVLSTFTRPEVGPNLTTLRLSESELYFQPGSFDGFFANSHLPQLKHLKLRFSVASFDQLHMLFTNQSLQQLESLQLLVANHDHRAFRSAPKSLRHLSIDSPRSNRLDYFLMADGALFPQLWSLNVGSEFPNALDRLENAEITFPELKVLVINGRLETFSQGRAIGRVCPSLESLVVGMSEEAVEGIASVDLPRLRRCDASFDLSKSAARAIASASWLPQLGTLAIENSGYEPGTAGLLARSVSHNLKCLSINTIDEDDSSFFVEAEHLDGLDLLALRRVEPRTEITKALRKRFGTRYVGDWSAGSMIWYKTLK